MFATKTLRRALASTAFAGVFAASCATAQVADPAPTRASIDGSGVDLFLGTMNVDGPVLSAGGSGPAGLAWRKFNRGGGGWGDNLVATLTVSGSTAYVGFGTSTAQFSISGSTYTSTEGDGATLSLSGGIYTYTAADGTVAHFTSFKVGAYPYATVAAIVSDIARPNGEQLTFTYETESYCSHLSGGGLCNAHADAYRIASVGNSSRYGLTFNYGSWGGFDENSVPDAGVFRDWGNVTSVSMSNAAIGGSSVRTQSLTSTTSGGSSYYTITDPMSRATEYRMNGASVAGIKLPGSGSEDVTVTYSSGKVASVTNPVGTWTYAYSDASGVRTVTVTNPASKSMVYTFDIASARMKSMTDATSRATTWNYDSSGRVTKVIAQEGNYVQTTYDARGNVTETRAVDKTGTSSSSDLVSTASYDSSCSNIVTCNQPNSTTDARGNTTDYTYDSSSGNLLTVTAPAPTTGATRPKTTYTYTTVNSVSVPSTTSTCQTGSSCAGTADEVKAITTYNANGLPDTVTRKAGDSSLVATTTIGYDDVGNVSSIDGPLSGSNDTVAYRYDADRERVGVIAPDPDGGGSLVRAAVKATYNDKGQVTVTEMGTVAGTSDSNWAAFSSSSQVTATLDAAGRPTRSVVTAGGTTYGVTEYSYDSVGRPDCVAVRLNPTYWGSATAACTAQTTGTDGPDRIARATYDDAGRTLTKTTAYGTGDAATETLTYTSNGKVETATDAETNKTTYEYDAFDRLKKTFYPVTTKGAGASNTGSSGDYEELTYDANGNVTNRRLRDNTNIGYTYDKLNRLTDKNLPGSELDVAYTYDLLGRTLTAATSAQTVTLTYDALSRLTSQATGTGTVGYEYDLAGRRTKLTWPDTFYVTYDYDTAGNLKAIKESGSTTLASFDYDSLGRRTLQTRGNGVTTSYSYDNASRLTSLASDLSGTTYDLTLGMSYNNAGQIKGTTRSNDVYSWTGSVNVLHSDTTNGLNQVTLSGGTSVGYDARGNLSSSGSDSYTYSSENLLLTGPAGASLSYDPLLRLYQVSNTATAATRFTYDGGNLIATSNTSGTWQRRYVTLPGTDEVIVEYKLSNSTKAWKILDERGSVVNATDPSGVGTAPNTYDEYGIPGSNAMRYQYTGQIWLGEVGLYYYKARMYSPTLGRFLQTDPIGYGDGSNWYNYVGGDPVNRRDPSGKFGLLGGCPAGSHCLSTDVAASNAAANERLIHYELPGVSSSLVSATAMCIFTSGCVASKLMGFDAPYIERVGISREDDPYRFGVDEKDALHLSDPNKYTVYFYYLYNRNGDVLTNRDYKVTEHIINSDGSRRDITGDLSPQGWVKDFLGADVSNGFSMNVATQTFTVFNDSTRERYDLISVFEHTNLYIPGLGQYNSVVDRTPGYGTAR
jgi:RHS repeat-associated protein